jgi:hypothetical protein
LTYLRRTMTVTGPDFIALFTFTDVDGYAVAIHDKQ